MEMDVEDGKSCVQIDDLPEEIMEYILSKVSPYRDLKSSMLVSRRWYRVASGILPSQFIHILVSLLIF